MPALQENEKLESIEEHGGGERCIIFNRIERERGRLEEACRSSRDGEREHDEISKILSEAERAASLRHLLRGRLSHNALEFAWGEVHEAETRIDQLLRDGELAATALDLLVKAEKMLPPNDERVQAVRRSLAQRSLAQRLFMDSLAVAHLARSVEERVDESYAKSAAFRNRLLGLTSLNAVLLGLLMWGLIGGALRLGRMAPPSSTVRIVLLTALFGAIGGLLGALAAVVRTGGTRIPFSLSLHQVLLKITLGSLFALVGAVLLTEGVLPGIEGPVSLAALLVWSWGFGMTQQAITRVADARVRSMAVP